MPVVCDGFAGRHLLGEHADSGLQNFAALMGCLCACVGSAVQCTIAVIPLAAGIMSGSVWVLMRMTHRHLTIFLHRLDFL